MFTKENNKSLVSEKLTNGKIFYFSIVSLMLSLLCWVLLFLFASDFGVTETFKKFLANNEYIITIGFVLIPSLSLIIAGGCLHVIKKKKIKSKKKIIFTSITIAGLFLCYVIFHFLTVFLTNIQQQY